MPIQENCLEFKKTRKKEKNLTKKTKNIFLNYVSVKRKELNSLL